MKEIKDPKTFLDHLAKTMVDLYLKEKNDENRL